MSSTTAELSTPKQAFQLKGSLFTLTVLRLLETDLTLFCQQLSATVEKAPKFFQQTPVVIDLTEVAKRKEPIDFEGIAQQLRANSLVPVGVCRGNAAQHVAAAKAGLGRLAENAGTLSPEKPVVESKAKTVLKPEIAQSIDIKAASKVITQPVRSGQQIYAKGGDLIVLASVSRGAELLADGHIHIYGTLNGRALAGVNGYKEARIFCQKLDAELVSIAGYYLLSDDQKPLISKTGACIALNGETLTISSL